MRLDLKNRLASESTIISESPEPRMPPRKRNWARCVYSAASVKLTKMTLLSRKAVGTSVVLM